MKELLKIFRESCRVLDNEYKLIGWNLLFRKHEEGYSIKIIYPHVDHESGEVFKTRDCIGKAIFEIDDDYLPYEIHNLRKNYRKQNEYVRDIFSKLNELYTIYIQN